MSVDLVEAARGSAPGATMSDAHSFPKPFLAWYTVFLLSLLFWLALVDRYILAFMIGPIRADLGISDFEVSLLQGVAFTFFYAFFGLPLGWAIDRLARRWVVIFGISTWSIATSLSGLSQTFPQLFGARMAVGAGEAVLNPSAYSILSDTFPKHRLGLAISVYAIGATLGSAFAYAFGGPMLDFVTAQDLSGVPILGDLRPWQIIFLFLGLLGIPVSLLMLTIPEPKRRGAVIPHKEKAPIFKDIAAYLKENPRFTLGHHLGFSFFTVMSAAITLWSPTFLIRTFGWSLTDAGIWLGITLLGGGLTGALVNGNIMDWLWRKGYHDSHLRWYVIVSLILIPLGLVMVLSGNVWVFLIGKFFYQMLSSSYSSAGGASLAAVTPNQLRGRASAVFMVAQNLIGNALGAVLVAAFTDFVFGDDAKVGYSLALLFVTALPLAAFFLWLGMKPMRKAADIAIARDEPVGAR